MPLRDLDKERQRMLDQIARVDALKENPPTHADNVTPLGPYSWLEHSEWEVKTAGLMRQAERTKEWYEAHRDPREDRAAKPQQLPTLLEMGGTLLETAGTALRSGKVDSATREARIAVCEACPSYNARTSQCRECGCFMKAKSWINGGPTLCPLQKWAK